MNRLRNGKNEVHLDRYGQLFLEHEVLISRGPVVGILMRFFMIVEDVGLVFPSVGAFKSELG